VNVVLAGGGTAGHIEPALALADALRRRSRHDGISLVGTAKGLETRLVPARGYELDLIPPVPLPRRLTPALLRVPGALRGAVRTAREVLEARDADVVVGFGGYVALPVYLAARRRRTPVVVHEANARAGLANKVGARFAHTVATSYADTALPRAQLVGIPLRGAIAELDRAAVRTEARRALGLAAELPTLLVTGGSQGARRINDAVTGLAAELGAAGVQVLHATGAGNYDTVVARLAAAGLPGDASPYVALAYVERMDLAYAAADVVLCRSGAMTVAEVTAVGLPAVFVPLPHGNGEQRRNAAHVVAAGGGVEVDDGALDTDLLRRDVLPLLRDPARIAVMSAAARASGNPDAADRLVDLVIAAAESRT
jgi:UDP-N-acetylglucosamine--N-acetylmuramyl-(pentapeptide) pyrophosphoryl-undecaprenol N-acetylglucosamine transferase